MEALEEKKDVTYKQISAIYQLSIYITPESLVNQLNENGTLLMISDEAGMLGNFSGRYSNNISNLDLLLESWNGEMYISDRATRDSIVLKKPYVSIA